MARFVYAKVYCDLLRHPRFRNRPDCDVRLALGLILEAKEHTDDGVLRDLTAASARGLCHIKASVAKVQEAIDHMVETGWLIPHPGLAYEIKDFVQRQASDSGSERMSRWRDQHRDEPVTKRHAPVNSGVTPASPDVEGEVEKKIKALSTSLTPTEEVFEHWQKVFRKPKAKLDSKRRRLISARLSEGRTVQELCRAVDGYRADPFTMGKNDRGKRFDDIALICRDAEHVERHLPQIVAPVEPIRPKKSDAEIIAEVTKEFEAANGRS